VTYYEPVKEVRYKQYEVKVPYQVQKFKTETYYVKVPFKVVNTSLCPTLHTGTSLMR